MFISVVFVIIVAVLGAGLLKQQEDQQRQQLIFLIAILVGFWSVFAFAMPGMGKLYDYLNQGRIDSLQSEISKENPPILPPMPFKDFLIVSFPSVLGVLSSLSYIGFVILSSLKKKIFFRWACLVVGWNLLMWILHAVIYHYFTPLPTVGQNIMVWVVWGLPFVVCFAFNLFWLYWISKQTNTPFRKAI